MHRIRTEAFIPAPPGRVWAVLADFDSYADWNPLNLKAGGKAALGARIPMVFRNPAKDGATIAQTVTITACEPGRKLEWTGHVPLLFKGRHFFHLTPAGPGTRLEHGEDQSGFIPWTFSKATIADKFVPAYEAVNMALATRLAATSG
jgi:hypothetical protein